MWLWSYNYEWICTLVVFRRVLYSNNIFEVINFYSWSKLNTHDCECMSVSEDQLSPPWDVHVFSMRGSSYWLTVFVIFRVGCVSAGVLGIPGQALHGRGWLVEMIFDRIIILVEQNILLVEQNILNSLLLQATVNLFLWSGDCFLWNFVQVWGIVCTLSCLCFPTRHVYKFHHLYNVT